jgi:hypothetical protein
MIDRDLNIQFKKKKKKKGISSGLSSLFLRLVLMLRIRTRNRQDSSPEEKKIFPEPNTEKYGIFWHSSRQCRSINQYHPKKNYSV